MNRIEEDGLVFVHASDIQPLNENTSTLILDHHLIRSMEGVMWLKDLRFQSKGKVMCAADFMEREPLFLEAWREDLYEWLPVNEGWHDLYAQGIENAGKFQSKGWKLLAEKGKITWHI